MRPFNIKMDGQIAVLAVAENGSYAAAGKVLGIGTSAVRKQVEGVTAEVGTLLFQRVNGRLVPTEAGRIYMGEARESVRRARLGLDRVQALIRARTSDLRVGYSSYLSEPLLDIVARLRPNSGGSRGFDSLLTYQVVSQILQGKLHIGFGFLHVYQPELMTRPLVEEPLTVCLPAGHRLSVKQSIEPVDLENEPMIAVGRKLLPRWHKEVDEYFESEGISLKFVRDAYLPREALWLVSKGVGVTLMTRSSAAPVRHDVVLRPLSSQLLTIKSGIFVRRDQYTGKVKEFVDKVSATTAALRPKVTKRNTE